ncbi:winged helix-turn-helix domain-containing protein [Maritimibacter sp. DP1N21-5]|uniref:winged helix-turn-helix domain-containing protein n=1 Tax=Maritimibacter sp. DP1N21-5 TaxID=2836867 RepID=UPI001C48219F|nr:winged helix-turn-helix domain-containing protein [Maritimibacter sp. DP1N21-5]MBV7410926.1 winged helix-turn-helix domain-containing protein [Maritimibacter sp. DP1N21-5]
MTDAPFPRLRLRLYFAPGEMMGPGKAELLEHIRDTGSISAAGRAMGMSYKRAWSLVEVMNAMFRAPVVESSRGGPKGGGAHLTETGEAVLAHYRALEAVALTGGAQEIDAMERLLSDMVHRK